MNGPRRFFTALALVTALFTVHGVAAAPPTSRIEPPATVRGILERVHPTPAFVVERDGVVVGYFTEVSGLGSETEVIEFREGGNSELIRKLPGLTRYPDVTLKRGLSTDLTLWTWRDEVVTGALARSTVTISLVRRDGRVVSRWELINAWPSKISGPSLKADGNDVALETLTLSHEGLTRTD
ncbi:MAG: phage tail protein [Gammaproteobacteria bacterium]|nr:phage tail protein [Gammaproteobacteria bacterium]